MAAICSENKSVKHCRKIDISLAIIKMAFIKQVI